jgi:hypothetical protein
MLSFMLIQVQSSLFQSDLSQYQSQVQKPWSPPLPAARIQPNLIRTLHLHKVSLKSSLLVSASSGYLDNPIIFLREPTARCIPHPPSPSWLSSPSLFQPTTPLPSVPTPSSPSTLPWLRPQSATLLHSATSPRTTPWSKAASPTPATPSPTASSPASSL